MDRKRSQSGLACFLQGMVGKKVYVEMVNEVYVNGILENADSYMNLKMKNVEIIRNEEIQKADEFSIQAKQVRFVHFEHSVDAQAVIRRSLNNSRRQQPNKKLDQEQSNSTRKTFEQ